VTDLGILRPAWVTLTKYDKGNYVTNSGTVYECTVGHTAGASFNGDSAYWTAAHFVQACTDFAINRINQYCNRDFRSASYTDTFTPESTNYIHWLNNPPGSALGGIKKFDEDTASYLTIFDGDDTVSNSARLEDGKVILFNGYSFSPAYSYQIVYTGGYSSVPELIKGACKQIGGMFYKSQGRLGLSSKNIGGQSDKGEGYDPDAETRILESVSMYKLYNV